MKRIYATFYCLVTCVSLTNKVFYPVLSVLGETLKPVETNQYLSLFFVTQVTNSFSGHKVLVPAGVTLILVIMKLLVTKKV